MIIRIQLMNMGTIKINDILKTRTSKSIYIDKFDVICSGM